MRIDTNGHGNLIHKRNIIPELHGLIDELCISLNAPNSEIYTRLCQPRLTGDVFQGILDFIRVAQQGIPCVTVTFLALPGIDSDEMKRLAAGLGVGYRIRHYDVVG